MRGLFGALASGAERKSAAAARYGSIDEVWGELFGRASRSGVAVTRESALRVTTALACTNRIAEGVATGPLKLYFKPPGSKDRIEARDRKLYHLLATKPNDTPQNSLELRETSAFHVRIAGNGYCWLNRVRGEIVEIVQFTPEQFAGLRRNRDSEWVYSFRMEGGAVETFPASEIWHVRGPSWNTAEGMGALKLLREALGLAIAEEETQSSLYANGGRPSGILSFKGMQSPESIATARAQWDKVRAGGTAVLDGEATWSKVAMSSVEAQHFEARRLQVEEICRGMGVMPIMVGHSDKAATYASSEQMFLQHLVHTVRPWHRRYEYSLDAQLLTEEERRAGYYFGFVDTEFLRGDHKTRAEYYKLAIEGGWMLRDEPRGFEEMNPVDGLDRPLVPANFNVIGADGLPIPPPKQGAAAPGGPEPTPEDDE